MSLHNLPSGLCSDPWHEESLATKCPTCGVSNDASVYHGKHSGKHSMESPVPGTNTWGYSPQQQLIVDAIPDTATAKAYLVKHGFLVAFAGFDIYGEPMTSVYHEDGNRTILYHNEDIMWLARNRMANEPNTTL